MRARACLAVMVLAGAAGAGEPEPARVRAAAEELGVWAAATGHPEVLATAIAALLRNGGSLDPDDPWSAAALLRALGDMPGGGALADALVTPDPRDVEERMASGRIAEGVLDGALSLTFRDLSAAGRGGTVGVTRAEISLAPVESAFFDLAFQAREPAILEARLKRGSDGAGVDLRVTDVGGAMLAQDLGPETGRPGFGLYVEWLPPDRVAARAELNNRGAGEAYVVMLTQPSSETRCGE